MRSRESIRNAENKWRASSPTYRAKMRSYAKNYKLTHVEEIKRKKSETKYRYGQALWRAGKRGLSWTISIENYAELISKLCFYCYGPLGYSGVGLDRKDSGKGYQLENVVSCCGDCNRIKCHLLSHEEMIIAMRAILNHRTGDQEAA